MSVQEFDLKSQLNLLMDKAQELGHLLILEADELINHEMVFKPDLLHKIKAYDKQKLKTFELLVGEGREYGDIQVRDLFSVQFDQLEQLLVEIQKRRNHKIFMQEELLKRINALTIDEREPLLLVYGGCLQGIKESSLWSNSTILENIKNHHHPIWQQLRSAEIVHEQRQHELEAVAKERSSNVTNTDADSTLDLLSNTHRNISLKYDKQPAAHDVTAENNLIFDDTFEIGKNMSLLKGRDLFPISPTKKSTVRNQPVNIPPVVENLPSDYVLDELDARTSSISDLNPHKQKVEVTNPAAVISSSQTKIKSIVDKNKPPQQKLRLDHDKATLLADLVLQNRGAIREHRKLDLVWELVRQRRFGLASLVTQRCEEDEHAPPAWLLRVLALTSSLYLPSGEVCRAIEKELFHFKPQVWAAAHQEDQQALGFLLRAAVLRMSLINPGKISSSILKSFSIKDGEVHLYNFCSRLVYFGQNFPRIGSLLVSPSSLKPIAHDHQGKSVVEEITIWIKQVSEKVLKFRETSLVYTTPNWSLFRSTNQREKQLLWSFIASTFFLNGIYKVLSTIRGAERGATSRVRQELSRIREGLNQPQVIGLKLPREFQLKQILPESVVELIQQGMSIADRWLVAEIPAMANLVTGNQDVLQLKEEVHKRYSSVMQELSQLRFESQSVVRVLSIDCLMEAFQDLRQLVDQQYEMPMQEVNPDHVINQELLRSSITEYDEKWQPQVTSQELEQAILDMLVHPEQSWVVAMKRIARRGGWSMLHELREIPNLLSSHEQAELEEYLKYIDQPQYREIMVQLAQLQQEMRQASQLKLITAEEFQACSWRITQISEENPVYWELAELKQEIEYLKKFLDKKREEEQAKIQARFAELNQKITMNSEFKSLSQTQNDLYLNRSETGKNINIQQQSDKSWIIDL